MRYLPFALAALLALAPLAAPAAEPLAPPAAAPATAAPADAATPADAGAEEAPGPWVYMVARVKLTGTDFTQVVFFKHPAITTVEECEAERTAGLTTGWVRFSRQYFRTFKGISYKVEYRCVGGPQYLVYWKTSDQLDRFYLVRTQNSRLEVIPQPGFFACRDALRKYSREESLDAFCAKASQAITEPPAPEAEAEAAAAAGLQPDAPAAPAPAPAAAPGAATPAGKTPAAAAPPARPAPAPARAPARAP